jgi:hypothetical protein
LLVAIIIIRFTKNIPERIFSVCGLLILVIVFCFSCGAAKKYAVILEKQKNDLINFEGSPSNIREDTIQDEMLVYWQGVRLHNPKYTSVTRIITFYINDKMRFANGVSTFLRKRRHC